MILFSDGCLQHFFISTLNIMYLGVCVCVCVHLSVYLFSNLSFWEVSEFLASMLWCLPWIFENFWPLFLTKFSCIIVSLLGFKLHICEIVSYYPITLEFCYFFATLFGFKLGLFLWTDLQVQWLSIQLSWVYLWVWQRYSLSPLSCFFFYFLNFHLIFHVY